MDTGGLIHSVHGEAPAQRITKAVRFTAALMLHFLTYSIL